MFRVNFFFFFLRITLYSIQRWKEYNTFALKKMVRVCKGSNRYVQPSGKEPRSFLIKFKLAVHLMRRHPDFSGLLAAGEYEIPVPNGVRDKNSFHRFGGMASRRNRKRDRLIFQRKRGIHFLSTKFHLERLQIHSYFPVSNIFLRYVTRIFSREINVFL